MSSVFRERVRAFLRANDPGPAPKDPTERLGWQRRWAALLVDEGFAAPSWPSRWGGMDLPLAEQVIYHEEFAKVRRPGHPGPGIFVVGPTIIKHGTDEQRQQFLRPGLRGDIIWVQGFSEPEAGSDLPSLRTRAERDGADYIVSGQKIWTTNARNADWLFALVRTGPRESRQHGISYLLIDMASPGVTVRPLRDMTGGSSFCEIFLDEVRVPVSNRVGEENEGWKIARTSMGHERSTAGVAQGMRYRRIVDELHTLAAELGRTNDPRVRQLLASIEIDVRLIILNNTRTLSTVLAGSDPGPVSSIGRLMLAEFEKRLHELAVDLIGAPAVLAPDDSHAVQRGRWVTGWLATRASTIGAGTAEIQRNTIAEQVLGLPRDDLAGASP
ncbi:acyl-CoA dehydrogenase family protein [Mycobacterium branderi]|uniref:Acyl-CoA dehydrogenase n=1 Tax=Mycobacterium branderi TaxID=43348 RepID=A0A7I7WED0_9MYCO|nr:acyl-CoA dehydrogenase family protein [Mycobacterium branderi]MCV7235201.1 acyl-CoA dehydrogenase family protein [Mycobacterium branderi]ORA31848.1 isovaleryl-CoA dehydrogenase [Mycobacterium branderi]BBZ14971.1 acyl-CoA dehydrogenase [Mycobacterium branderi]